jgi:hypothetical protein
MSDAEIITKLREMAKLYNGTGDEKPWTLYDLQNDIEDIFTALEERITILEDKNK